MATKLIELGHAVAAYYSFTDELSRKDIAWTYLKPSQPVFVGNPSETHGPIRMYLAELAANGFIDRKSIPEKF